MTTPAMFSPESNGKSVAAVGCPRSQRFSRSAPVELEAVSRPGHERSFDHDVPP